MKILWLNPINASKNSLSVSHGNFMAYEKNEIARSIKGIGNVIVSVVCYYKTRINMSGFSNVTYFKILRPKWIFKLFYHFKMLKSFVNQNFDVVLFGVHASHLIPLVKLISLLKTHKSILVYDIRSVPVDLDKGLKSKFEIFRYHASLKVADRLCNGITCITPMLGDTLKPKLAKLKNKIGYFQTGVNFRMFDPSESSSLRELLKLETRFIVIYHGVLSPNRGLQNVIKAIAICKRRIPHILFMMVGTGAGESELKNITKELRLEKNVLFTGGVPFKMVPDYIKSADVGIIPLPAIDWWNVSSPIKLKEYLAMQIPIIATDIPAHRLVVNKTGGATLIKNHDPRSIAQAILTFFNNPKPIYPMKTRKELYDLISFKSQAVRFIDYVNKL
jgi:glycosyltransferase involved in cell wall biosynthesis